MLVNGSPSGDLGMIITCCDIVRLTRFMIRDAVLDLASLPNKAPQTCGPAFYIAESVSHCDQRRWNCQNNAEHVLGNEFQVKPCSVLDVREFEISIAKKVAIKTVGRV